jgi:hypothetical protein
MPKKPKVRLVAMDGRLTSRSYFERDEGKTCSACGRSWAEHTDYEWSYGCKAKP